MFNLPFCPARICLFGGGGLLKFIRNKLSFSSRSNYEKLLSLQTNKKKSGRERRLVEEFAEGRDAGIASRGTAFLRQLPAPLLSATIAHLFMLMHLNAWKSGAAFIDQTRVSQQSMESLREKNNITIPASKLECWFKTDWLAA